MEDTDDQDLALLESMSDEEVLAGWSEKGWVWVDFLAEAGDYERAIRLMEAIQHAPAPLTASAETQKKNQAIPL